VAGFEKKNHPGPSATLYPPTSILVQIVCLKAVSSAVTFETAKEAEQDYRRVTVYLIIFF
jgi:hypothetical protein